VQAEHGNDILDLQRELELLKTGITNERSAIILQLHKTQLARGCA
jgi:hypothetical protein